MFRGCFQNYTFVDRLTQAYGALVALIILLFHGGALPHWIPLLLTHVVGALVLHALICNPWRWASNPAFEILRHYYPIPLFVGFYTETETLNQLFYKGYLDIHFLRWEQRLFGMQPGLDWMARFPSTWFAEVLFAAYFSYYFMIAGMGLTLLLRDRKQFAHFMAIVSLVLYLCYLVYILLPVVGPRVLYPGVVDPAWVPDWPSNVDPTPPDTVRRAMFFKLMEWIYEHFEKAGAAFPSSHVAVAVVTLYFSFRYLRVLRYPHLIAVMLLCVSTVYGRYHYLIDVFGGLLLAAVMIPMGNRLYRRYGEDQQGCAQRSRDRS
jgi:membrane-associated phospholipid phosphatase